MSQESDPPPTDEPEQHAITLTPRYVMGTDHAHGTTVKLDTWTGRSWVLTKITNAPASPNYYYWREIGDGPPSDA